NQTVAVLHQRVAHETQPRFFARSLAVETSVGVGGRGMHPQITLCLHQLSRSDLVRWHLAAMRRQWAFQLLREELTCLDRTRALRFKPKRDRCAADIPLDFTAKASIAVG